MKEVIIFIIGNGLAGLCTWLFFRPYPTYKKGRDGNYNWER